MNLPPSQNIFIVPLSKFLKKKPIVVIYRIDSQLFCNVSSVIKSFFSSHSPLQSISVQNQIQEMHKKDLLKHRSRLLILPLTTVTLNPPAELEASARYPRHELQLMTPHHLKWESSSNSVGLRRTIILHFAETSSLTKALTYALIKWNILRLTPHCE